MSEEASSISGSATRLWGLVASVAVAVVAGGYAIHEHRQAQQFADQNTKINSTLNATRDQLSALSTKFDAMNAKPSAEAPAATHPGTYRKPMTAASQHRRIDDPRWKKMQGQLDEQGKQIESTRQELTSARTDLEGSIAKNHDDLVLLQMKGERNYFEFDLDKSGQFQREGPVGVKLRKANTKHEYADLELMVDDFKVSKKHVDIYEPVVFYSADSKMPVELVINSISKNHIHGYVSEPKFNSRDLEAKANPSAGNAATSDSDANAANAKPSAARQTLPPPKTN